MYFKWYYDNQRALRASSFIVMTIFIAPLYPANVNQKRKEKTVTNRTGLFLIVLPVAMLTP